MNAPASAWEQLSGENERGEYPVTGLDGGAYLARHEWSSHDRQRMWTIYRADTYGGPVTRSGSLKGAVQRLNAFHIGETCIHCQHVNSTRGHACDQCGKRRYA